MTITTTCPSLSASTSEVLIFDLDTTLLVSNGTKTETLADGKRRSSTPYVMLGANPPVDVTVSTITNSPTAYLSGHKVVWTLNTWTKTVDDVALTERFDPIKVTIELVTPNGVLMPATVAEQALNNAFSLIWTAITTKAPDDDVVEAVLAGIANVYPQS